MHPPLPHHQLPLSSLVEDDGLIERTAATLDILHSKKGQGFLVGGACHMTAEKAWKILQGIDRDPCGAPHHRIMPRGRTARCSTARQQNTLHCAHGSQLPLQQVLVAAVVLHIIDPQTLDRYVDIRILQKKVLLEADNLLTSGYAIAARGKDDPKSQQHLQRMELPLTGVTTKDVHDWMCEKQEESGSPLLPIIDAIIEGLQQRFPALLEKAA